MDDLKIRQERAQNLWTSVQRKTPPLASATILEPSPQVEADQIGGLAQAQDEVVTYACALTNPELYESWGTFPPSGLLLIGHPGTGKSLLAAAMATRAGTPFLRVELPRLALEIVHHAGQAVELLDTWSHALQEMPPLSVFFHELEFSQAQAFGFSRPDLPIGPIMDFLLEFIERAIAIPDTLVVGSTTSPVTLRHAFLAPGRFERVVEVTPSLPGRHRRCPRDPYPRSREARGEEPLRPHRLAGGGPPPPGAVHWNVDPPHARGASPQGPPGVDRRGDRSRHGGRPDGGGGAFQEGAGSNRYARRPWSLRLSGSRPSPRAQRGRTPRPQRAALLAAARRGRARVRIRPKPTPGPLAGPARPAKEAGSPASPSDRWGRSRGSDAVDGRSLERLTRRPGHRRLAPRTDHRHILEVNGSRHQVAKKSEKSC